MVEAGEPWPEAELGLVLEPGPDPDGELPALGDDGVVLGRNDAFTDKEFETSKVSEP
jgi:hypothetical protein